MGSVNLVHIIDTPVCGISAFHAHCGDCGWRCHKRPHDTEAQAILCAENHQNAKH